ncbi:hypothetical protein [Arthrobacter sp. STN4]|uniref:hypothetical protein n=1 Tax=Arthrobacter sp. STN4 TaxID=2923276 RepID=UPI002119F15D|nr:hypothetical protein [Arthrobacter sp. STN4]MCQ9163991.1 hypothetical protein [Arthrobacter sp. STN4]
MTGRIELHHGPDGVYYVKMVNDDGNTIAVTIGFLSEKAALEGVFALREIAGTANISVCTTRGTPADHLGTGNRRHTSPVPLTSIGHPA